MLPQRREWIASLRSQCYELAANKKAAPGGAAFET